MFEGYYGLIEVLFVFALAIAFYIWQSRSLARDIAARKDRERDEASSGPASAPRHAEGEHRLDDRTGEPPA